MHVCSWNRPKNGVSLTGNNGIDCDDPVIQDRSRYFLSGGRGRTPTAQVMRRAMLRAVMTARLDCFSAYMKAVFAGLIRWPTAHPRLDVTRGMVENRFLEDNGFWLWLFFGNFGAALQIQPVRLTDYRIACYAAAEFFCNLPCRQTFSP